MFQDITVEKLLALRDGNELVSIDVRSPSEYRNATIPGSINIPLFNDEERAEVGTIYSRIGVEEAKVRGLELVSAKLPAFIRAFSEIPSQKAVFCWRGGMRSKTTATLLSLMGIRVYRLSGGVRSYRKWVVAQLEAMKLTAPAYVIAGHTGAGKTAILRQLMQDGYPVLDLEGMAGHRGSIFGHVGLTAANQKTFDALLVERLSRMMQAPYLLMEGESKRIGKIVLPEFLSEKKDAGIPLLIELPLEARARNIVHEYQPHLNRTELLQAYQRIKERIHTPVAKEIEGLLTEGEYEYAVRLLLEYYYDPRYEHAMNRSSQEAVIIRAATVEEAYQAVKQALPVLQQNG